jgi:hypothetical protein
MNKVKILLPLIILAVFWPQALAADEKDFSVSLSAASEWMFGFTSYGIGWNTTDAAGNPYTIGFKVSELAFPLNTLMVGADLDLTLFRNFFLDVRFRKSVTAEAGKMKDSDWGVWYLEGNAWASSSTLDVFSLSTSRLNAYTIDGDFLYDVRINRMFSLFFGLGFLYQQFYSEVSDVDQWYPSYQIYQANLDPSYANHVTVAGLVGTYEVMYFIPKLVVSGRFNASDFFLMDLTLAGTPILKAVDTDYHVLRSKRSNGDCGGWALQAKLDISLRFTPNFFAGLSGDLFYLDGSGTQSQYRYNDTSEGPAGSLGTIDMKLTCFRFAGGIHAGWTF